MEKEFYTTLLHRSFSGLTTKKEETELKKWLAENKEHRALKKDLWAIWKGTESIQQPIIENKQAFTQNALSKIHQQLAVDKPEPKVVRLPKKRIWLKYAAGIAFLIMAGIASLTLSNEVETIIAQTEANEHKKVELPDGTLVWLNENSTLSYPAEFSDAKREVILKGQGYFEVFKQKNHPFIIDGGTGQVEVLGTQFDFQTKTSQQFSVVNVQEGKVKFFSKENDQAVILTQNMQGKLDLNSGAITKINTATINAIAWKTKIYEFDKWQLKDVFDLLEKNYSVKIDYEKIKGKCLVSSRFDNDSIDVMLNILTTIVDAKVLKLDKNTYKITGGACN